MFTDDERLNLIIDNFVFGALRITSIEALKSDTNGVSGNLGRGRLFTDGEQAVFESILLYVHISLCLYLKEPYT
jgi:hypothetical protein